MTTPIIDNLPEASLLQKSDLIPAVERGLAIGGITGALAGIAAVVYPPTGLAPGGGTILIIRVSGAVIGAWVAGMIGVDVRNTQILRFQSQTQIDQGEILLMVDVAKAKTQTINQLVHRLHPQAQIAGTEPQIPAFP